MALSLEAINLVKQKVRIALAGASPVAQLQFKALWHWLATHKSNENLQFVAFADLTGDTVIADAAHNIYAIYAKKQATATDAFFKVVDHATVAAGTTFAICVELNEASDEAVLVYPKGFAQGTGSTIVSSTTDVGGTDSTSGDGPNGFFVIAAS